MAFYNKLVLTNIGERTLNEALSSDSNLLLSELRLSADVYSQTEVKNLVSLSNTANIIATSSVILEKETGNFIVSGSFSNKDITELLTINSIGLYSTLNDTTKLIGVATAIEPIIIKPFRNTVNFYNLKLSLALKQSEYNAIEIINGDSLDISVLDYYVKKSEMTVEIADINAQLDEKANLSYVEQAIADTVDAQANPSIASQLEALTGTNNTNMMTPLRTKEVILESATIVVNHGTNSSIARPSGASVVYWIGTVEPTNATNNDLWVGGL